MITVLTLISVALILGCLTPLCDSVTRMILAIKAKEIKIVVVVGNRDRELADEGNYEN